MRVINSILNGEQQAPICPINMKRSKNTLVLSIASCTIH